ncbi:class I SAM-dependent methyltransferase [Kitasatospora sp. NPDC059827]|uniref:class I SAM-dependent methyltransferase n=1 Tax=Kitasatospora sp. NPDC059827 TaxID=3346964 RepID=UPI00364F1ADC
MPESSSASQSLSSPSSLSSLSYLSTTADAYDALAERYADHVKDGLARLPLDRSFVAAFADLVRENVANASGSAPMVADLGCGPGYLTAALREWGLDAFGVDLSPALVAIARRTYPHLRFEVGSMDALRAGDGELDGVVSWYSLIHTPPRQLPSYLAEFRRVLAPGGYALLGFFESEDDPVTAFDHKVTTAYRWPVDHLAALAHDAGLAENARLLRAPGEGERFRHGRLLLRAV